MQQGLSILVVDDEPAFALALAEVLRAEHHDVETAYDGRAALAQASSHAFELILADLLMPHMGGDELLAALRQSGKAMPYFVIMSSLPEAVVRARAPGVERFLPKPIRIDALLGLVQECARDRDDGAREARSARGR